MSEGIDVLFEKHAREKLFGGIRKLYLMVSKTLGPKGKIILLKRENDRIHVTKDGVTVAKELVLRDPIEMMGAQMIRQAAMKTAEKAGDGPQPLYSKILTPDGWKQLKDIKPNDIICGSNSTIQRVEEVYYKGELEVYYVIFSDGRVVECSENHLWVVQSKRKKDKVITTESMKKDFVRIKANGDKEYKYYIKPHIAYFNENTPFSIDPFLLGLLLGDGSLSGTGSIELSIGKAKAYLIDKIKLPIGMSLSIKYYEKKNYYRIKIIGCTADKKYMKDLLHDLNLLGVKSDTKFIPNMYLFSSIESRNALLEGLLSTDGYINKRGLFEFSTISPKLADDFISLICSLGISFNKRLHNRNKDKNSYSNKSIYRINQLKGFDNGYKIIDIRSANKKEPMGCIKVSNADHLYFTDGFITTHNTTTSTILAYHFIVQGNELVKKGYDPNVIKKEWDSILEIVLKELSAKSKPIKTKEQLQQIATISANNDSHIGNDVGDLVYKMGSNGVITIERSANTETSVSYVHGLQLDAPYASPYFVNAPKIMSTTFAQTKVFLYDGSIYNLKEIITVLDFCQRNNHALLIIAKNIDPAVIQLMVENRVKNNVSWAVPKLIGTEAQKNAYMEDIAILTGGKVFHKGTDQFDPHNINFLGTADRIENNDLHLTIVVGDKQDPKILANYIDKLEKEFVLEANEMTQHFIRTRINKLKGGVAVVYVGAPTELEMLEKKDRVEDAVLAAKSAMKEGILPGAGYALYSLKPSNEVAKKTKDIVLAFYQVLTCPRLLIHTNAGFTEDSIVDKLDIESGLFITDFIKAGIIDPTIVVRQALENALSVATMILLTEGVIYKEFPIISGPPRLNAPGAAFPQPEK